MVATLEEKVREAVAQCVTGEVTLSPAQDGSVVVHMTAALSARFATEAALRACRSHGLAVTEPQYPEDGVRGFYTGSFRVLR